MKFRFELLVNLAIAWQCNDIILGGKCFKEIDQYQELVKGGMLNAMQPVVDGYSPLGSNETLPCPDGTFAHRKGLLFWLQSSAVTYNL